MAFEIIVYPGSKVTYKVVGITSGKFYIGFGCFQFQDYNIRCLSDLISMINDKGTKLGNFCLKTS